jgi:transposase InsO family protein
LKTDNGSEFINNKLHKYCQERGISITTSVPYNPEQNGCAERRNRTLIEGARTMLKDSDLGKDLWGEAISTHVYIHKRCPSSILPNNIVRDY